MKKQIGLIALTTLFVTFVAFSGVVSAQASNVQVFFFTSPLCGVCQTVEPRVQSAVAQYGVQLTTYDVTTAVGRGIAQANGVSGTPTIIISGAQSARFVGDVSQAQIAAAIRAAIGTATPTPTARPTPTPTPTPTARPTPTPTPKVVIKATATPKAVVKATATPKAVVKVAVKATPKVTAQPTIEVVQATETPTKSAQTVPEFSLLGLGAPALIVGAIYLFLRRR